MKWKLLVFTVCACLLALSAGMGIRFFVYVQEHGGMPTMHRGRPALNGGEGVTYVSQDVYNEARARWYQWQASLIGTIITIFVLLVLLYRKQFGQLLRQFRTGDFQ